MRSKDAVYLRGSYFCGGGCRDTWASENPAPVARGADLQREASVTIDETIVEFGRAFGLAPLRAQDERQLAGNLIGALAGVNKAHNAEARNEALLRFQGFILRCPPLLRALGRPDVAHAIDSVDIMKTLETAWTAGDAERQLRPLVDALRGVRAELARAA